MGFLVSYPNRLKDAFEDSPSLKSYYHQVFEEAYQDARQEAQAETGLSLETFPVNSLFTLNETLDPEYLPN